MLIPIILCFILSLAAALSIPARTEERLIRIMPLGDSITQGAADTDSFRRPLWKLLKTSNARVDFVGSMKTNYPHTRLAHSDFDINHEGHWGWRADEVLAKIDGWAEQTAPNIVLIHLGSNDIHQKQKNKATVEELRQIIATLRKHNERIEIFLARLIPIADKPLNMKVEELNNLLSNMAQSTTTDDSPVHIVNQYEGFDAFKDTYDGVHPNRSGIEKMAQKWHKALMTISKLEM